MIAEPEQRQPEQREPTAAGDAATSWRGGAHVAVVLFVWAVVLALTLVFFGPLTLVGLLFVAAAALAALLRPVARWVSRAHAGAAGLAVGLIFWAVIIGLAALMGVVMAEPIQRELGRLDEIQAQLDAALAAWGQTLGIADPPNARQLGEAVLQWFGTGFAGSELLAQVADRVTVLLVGIALVMFGSIFLLAEPPGRVVGTLAKLLPRHQRQPLIDATNDLEVSLRWWLIGLMVSMTIVGGGAYLGFLIVGLEFALPLALIAGVAEVVPVLGPVLAFALALFFASTEGPREMLGVMVVWVFVATLESYVILPLVMRQAVHMPPLVSLFTVVLWSRILGLLGLLLAIPLNLIIWAFVYHYVIRRRPENPEAQPSSARAPPPPEREPKHLSADEGAQRPTSPQQADGKPQVE